MFSLLGVQGLAMGHAIAYVVATTLLARALSRAIGGLDVSRIARSAGRISAAAGVMGLVVWGASRAVEGSIDVTTIVGQVVAVAIPVITGGVAYLFFARVFRVEELAYVRSLLGRGRGR
jgi:peptidoglycan biosynthesis protein MviN/MurJ (putative lipid II flippase)